MKEIINVFESERFGKLRVIMKDGESWFVAKDVCDALEISNVTQALSRLDDDERSMFNIGRQGEANIINEYGLYSLILGSRKQEALEFKRWVTHDILPSIRKTGNYSLNNSAEINNTLVYAIANMTDSMSKLITRVNKLEDKIDREKSSDTKWNYEYKNNNKIYSVTDIAKLYSTTAKDLNNFLESEGIQEKINNQWILTNDYKDNGYTEYAVFKGTDKQGNTFCKNIMKWTLTGRKFIEQLLDKENI